METRPSHHPPQKLRQARAAYRKSGGQPRLSHREYRELQRGAELLQRATKIQEAERRKKLNQQKRAEKEQQEREAKRRKLLEDRNKGKIFVGSTQFPRSQFRIEKFITGLDGSVEEKLEVSADPWDKDDVDDGSLLEVLDDFEASAKPIPSPKQSVEKRRFSSGDSDDFDLGLSIQDFEAVEFGLSTELLTSCSAVIEETTRPQTGRLMPPPARPQTAPAASERIPSLPAFGVSSQDLDALALAEFEPSQAIR